MGGWSENFKLSGAQDKNYQAKKQTCKSEKFKLSGAQDKNYDKFKVWREFIEMEQERIHTS